MQLELANNIQSLFMYITNCTQFCSSNFCCKITLFWLGSSLSVGVDMPKWRSYSISVINPSSYSIKQILPYSLWLIATFWLNSIFWPLMVSFITCLQGMSRHCERLLNQTVADQGFVERRGPTCCFATLWHLLIKCSIKHT